MIDLSNKRFGRLIAKYPTDKRINSKVVWHCNCDCGNEVEVISTSLIREETRSCGCLKAEVQQVNLREKYDPSKLFKDKEPRRDSSTGYRGVSRYFTRKSKEERYRAWITVNGKRYYKSGFLTARDAYYNGRLKLEELHLHKKAHKNRPSEN